MSSSALLISLQSEVETLGLKYIHYTLLERGCGSVLLNLPGLQSGDRALLEKIAEFIAKTDPSFIGISLMSHEFGRAAFLSDFLRSRFRVPLIWGGIHPTIAPEMSLGHCDYACAGEGEKAIIDIACALEKGESLDSVNNLCYMKNGRCVKNQLNPLMEDLDSLPVIEHRPRNNFILHRGEIREVDRRIYNKYARWHGATYSVMASRGCPYSCTYCCNNFISKLYGPGKIRRRSMENVIGEIEKALKDNPGIKVINFLDDCFLAAPDAFLEEFAKVYSQRIARPFIIRCPAAFVTESKMKSLKKAGIAWINIGLQSGSDRISFGIYGRKSGREHFIKAAELARSFRVAAFYDIILDNPFETAEDVLITAELLLETPRPFYAQLFSLSFFHGTELREKAMESFPALVSDPTEKDYHDYGKNMLNDIVRISAYFNRKFVKKIAGMYRRNPGSPALKLLVFTVKIISGLVYEPLASFRVIKMTQGGSFLRALGALPIYFKGGIQRFLRQFNFLN